MAAASHFGMHVLGLDQVFDLLHVILALEAIN